jgi:hypothetical protein
VPTALSSGPYDPRDLVGPPGHQGHRRLVPDVGLNGLLNEHALAVLT